MFGETACQIKNFIKRRDFVMTNYAIIVAGGKGSRMQSDIPKQFLLLGQKPILIHTLEAFERCKIIDKIIVACSKDYIFHCDKLLREYDFKKVAKVIEGGEQRQNSVCNALKFIDSDVVCIHDGVRPFVKSELIEKVVGECKNNDGCICAVKVKDTIKRCSEYALETLDRENLYQVQTPQAFKTEKLKRVYDLAAKENFIGTDDSSLMEHYGYKIKVVEGDSFNIKITTPEDLIFGQIYLGIEK